MVTVPLLQINIERNNVEKRQLQVLRRRIIHIRYNALRVFNLDGIAWLARWNVVWQLEHKPKVQTGHPSGLRTVDLISRGRVSVRFSRDRCRSGTVC
jgi:hypothetical protein